MPEPDRDDAGVVDRGVGDQLHVVACRDDADGRDGHRTRARCTSSSAPIEPRGPPRGRSGRRGTTADERAVELDGAEQRGHRGRRLVVGLGQPAVHRREPELRAVAEDDQREPELAPERPAAGARPRRARRGRTSASRLPGGLHPARQAGEAEQHEPEADRGEEEVAPGRRRTRAAVAGEAISGTAASVVSSRTIQPTRRWFARIDEVRGGDERQRRSRRTARSPPAAPACRCTRVHR